MTARRDLDRLVRSYLEDGPTELPDRSFDAVRDHIDHTRQRVVIGPWRFRQMTNFVRIGMAAAAVVVLAVLGVKLLPEQGTSGAPPQASISPTATPTESAAASAMPLGFPNDVGIPAGTYYRYEGYGIEPRIRVTFTLPAGWTANENSFLYKNRGKPGEVMFLTWIVTHVYPDACKWIDKDVVAVGPTPDDLITALARQEGRAQTASGPWRGSIAGLPAVGVELAVPADLDTSTCTNGFLRYWPDPGPNFSGGLCCNPPGNIDFVYAVDVNGRTIAVVTRRYAGSSAADVAELEGIIQSLQLE